MGCATETCRTIELARFALAPAGDQCSIGSHPSNALVLDDATVSRFHCEVWMDPGDCARIHDLESRNGTIVDGLRVKEAWLRDGSTIRLGRTALRFRLGRDSDRSRRPRPGAT